MEPGPRSKTAGVQVSQLINTKKLPSRARPRFILFKHAQRKKEKPDSFPTSRHLIHANCIFRNIIRPLLDTSARTEMCSSAKGTRLEHMTNIMDSPPRLYLFVIGP